MLGVNALIGQPEENPDANPKKSKDEEDLQLRSKKRTKDGNHVVNVGSVQSMRDSAGRNYPEMEDANGRSYRDMILGRNGGIGMEEGSDAEETEGDEVEDREGIKVEERKIGDYACPEFVFSKTEEKRIYRPWRRGVIVKLLGRRIGYKALETRLKQMWVRKGVISIIDLGNDYYLVLFTHEDDKYAALMDGPWFIYDHYLTVKEWSPNFHPESDTIKEVAVWVRITGLPIEFYDSKILNFIGNRVGKTVKVDKNTLTQERGKYARLCVQVNLTEPLLAMFTIKGRKYNIEYEGLHMLCLTCGKFGHYKEGCPDKTKNVGQLEESSRMNDGRASGGSGSGVDGPWRVVQKQKRGRKPGSTRNSTATEGKGNNIPAKVNASLVSINDTGKNSGSRFISLSDHNDEINEEDLARERNDLKNSNNNDSEVMNGGYQILHGNNVQNMSNNRGSNGGGAKKGETNHEKTNKEKKLAARGGGNFKGKIGSNVKKVAEIITEEMGTHLLESLKVQSQQPIGNNEEPTSNDGVQKENSNATRGHGLAHNIVLAHEDITSPNMPRPPNLHGTTQPISSSSPLQDANMGWESEIFEDANDQGSVGNSESDMEIINETPLRLQ
ncbi:zinc ion binding / nucleic acid binding protein [Trifolium repens]|nr:zinc ion binding / nucleic acid binding protein [Trifolium repens]